MATPELRLYHFPGACSRVSVCALEMAELDYELTLVDLAKGEQGAVGYRTVSPMAKVPVLTVDGEPLLENAAILTLIHRLRPDAGILSSDPAPWMQAQSVGGLSFCGGTLHPIVRGLANPQRITTGDGDPVRERSRELAIKSFGHAEARLAERGWWLGERSIVDVYLDWAFAVACRAGFDAGPYPELARLARRLMEMPAYVRMLEEEDRSRRVLQR